MRNHDFTVILSEFGEINARAWQHVDFWKERDEEEERKGKEKIVFRTLHFSDVTLFRYTFHWREMQSQLIRAPTLTMPWHVVVVTARHHQTCKKK